MLSASAVLFPAHRAQSLPAPSSLAGVSAPSKQRTRLAQSMASPAALRQWRELDERAAALLDRSARRRFPWP